MNDHVLPMTDPENDPQRLARWVEAFFDALDRGEPVSTGSLQTTLLPDLDTSPITPTQQNLDDANHEHD